MGGWGLRNPAKHATAAYLSSLNNVMWFFGKAVGSDILLPIPEKDLDALLTDLNNETDGKLNRNSFRTLQFIQKDFSESIDEKGCEGLMEAKKACSDPIGFIKFAKLIDPRWQLDISHSESNFAFRFDKRRIQCLASF